MPKNPRSPSQGDDFEDGGPTPLPVDVDEIVRRLWPLRKSGDLLIELQTRVQHLERNPEQVAEDLGELKEHIVDIKGKSGTNGKIGNLRADLEALKAKIEKQEARRWTVIVTLIGMILTAATLAVTGGRWVGQLENRVEQNSERLDRILYKEHRDDQSR
jgi:hypothetical protein